MRSVRLRGCSIQEHFNVNFSVDWDILLEQSNCASVGLNKRLDNIEMNGATMNKQSNN